MLRAYERDIVSHRLLPRVIAEYRQPSFEEFGTRRSGASSTPSPRSSATARRPTRSSSPP